MAKHRMPMEKIDAHGEAQMDEAQIGPVILVPEVPDKKVVPAILMVLATVVGALGIFLYVDHQNSLAHQQMIQIEKQRDDGRSAGSFTDAIRQQYPRG